MRANLSWFSDGQWARIEPLIPSNRRGVKPKNNRRILSGIMHVLKGGCRWVDCPPEYGPAKTVYNRFNRRSAQGIWQSIFPGLPCADSRLRGAGSRLPRAAASMSRAGVGFRRAGSKLASAVVPVAGAEDRMAAAGRREAGAAIRMSPATV